MRHTPVLLNEVVVDLKLAPGAQVIDATLGDGGHSEAMLKLIGPNGRLLGLDADAESLARARRFLLAFREQVTLVEANFSTLETVAKEYGFSQVDAILFDLGWSTPQFKERGRGFSFEKPDEPLDMRFSPALQYTTAADILNETPIAELASLLRRLGEEPLAMPIATAIGEERKKKPLRTVGDAVAVVLSAYRTKLKSTKEIPWVGGLHPATKVFQALRIAVNDELGVLERVLPQAFGLLKPGGRLVIITFHSLEDRIVKHFFQKIAHARLADFVHKKPSTASASELKENPAARSAKLRSLYKL